MSAIYSYKLLYVPRRRIWFWQAHQEMRAQLDECKVSFVVEAEAIAHLSNALS